QMVQALPRVKIIRDRFATWASVRIALGQKSLRLLDLFFLNACFNCVLDSDRGEQSVRVDQALQERVEDLPIRAGVRKEGAEDIYRFLALAKYRLAVWIQMGFVPPES